MMSQVTRILMCLMVVYHSQAASIAPSRLSVSQSAVSAAANTKKGVSLPTFKQIFDAASSDSVQGLYSVDGCDVTLVATGCQVSMHSSCLKLSKIIQKSLPGKSVTDILGQVGTANGRDNWPIGEVTINRCLKAGSFKATTSQRIQVVHEDHRHVILDPFTVEVSFANTVSSLNIVFSGNWKIGILSFPAVVVKDADGLHFKTTKESQSLTLNEFVANAGSKSVGAYPLFPKGKVVNVLARMTQLNNVNVLDASAIGDNLSTGSGYRLNVGLSIVGIKAQLYLSIITFANGTQVYHAAYDLPSTKLASLVKQFTPIDLSSIPILKDLSIDVPSILISDGNTSAPFIPFPAASNLNNMGPIEEGMAVVFQGSFSSGGSKSTFMIRYKAPSKDKVGTFKFKLSGVKPKASALMNTLLKQFGSVTLPPKFNIDSFLAKTLQSFEYDAHGKIFTVAISLGSNIQLIPNSLDLESPVIKFKINVGSVNASSSSSSSAVSKAAKSASGRVTVEISSDISLGSVVIKLKLTKPAGASVFVAEGSSTSDIPIGNLVKKFALALLPKPLEFLVKKAKLDAFKIGNPAVSIVFAKEFGFSLMGRTIISSFDKTQVQVIMGKTEAGTLVMATGLVLEKTPISKVVQTMTSLNLAKVPGVKILDNAKVGIVMASSSIMKQEKYLKFNLSTFQNLDIQPGLTLASTFTLPSDCGSDIFCKVLGRFFPSTMTFKLAGRMTATSVMLKATVPTTIQIISGLSITDLGIEVEVGTKNSIGLTGQMDFKNPNLHFSGGLGMSASGAYLKMSTIGIWENVLGLKFIAISNLNFELNIVPDPVLVSAIHFGGTVRLGYANNANAVPITASVYVGVNRINPNENYFYGKINVLTIPALVKAFGKTLNLPKPVANTGFPNGVFLSMALQGRTLPNGVSIKQGFFLKGELNILGLRLKSEVSIDINGIYIDMRASPLKLAGNIISVKGLKAGTGPRVLVDLRWNPAKALVIVQGSVTLFRMQRTVNITIDHQNMHLKLTGRMFAIFDATLELKASYSSLNNLAFQVKGSFKQDLLGKLREGVKNTLNNYAKHATKEIGKHQKQVTDQIAKVRRLQNTFDSKKKDFDIAAAKIAGAKRVVANRRNSVKNFKAKFNAASRVFNAKKCGSTSHCTYKRKRSIYAEDENVDEKDAKKFLARKKRWGVRRWRVRVKSPWEYVMEAKRLAERVARYAACKARNVAVGICRGVLNGLAGAVRAAAHTLRVAEVAMRAAEWTLSRVEQGVRHSKGIMDAAKGLLEPAKLVMKGYERSLEGVKIANRFGTKCASTIASAALGGLVDVQELTFDIQLAKMKGGSFSGSIRVSFFNGRPQTFRFKINVRSVASMVNSLVSKAKNLIG